VEALRRVEPAVGEHALALLRTDAAAAGEAVVAALANDLAVVERRVTLVLDDYHTIENPQIHGAVGLLLEHLPASLHLALASRADPPLPIARMRVRGEMTEIRASDLHFSQEEATAFLNDVLALELAQEDVAPLWARTEGWPAGLYLAALSLAGRDDRSAFVDAFAGDDRHVVDYLLAEVLDGAPADVRTFLVRTSLLERLSGPLCDAVLETSGSAQVLHRLERSNLFLVSLDTRRRWYRYHHLFADLLAVELHQAEPERVTDLHRRASEWFREHGFVPAAIRHAVDGEDVAGASDLVALHWNDFVNQGRIDTVSPGSTRRSVHRRPRGRASAPRRSRPRRRSTGRSTAS
jgi:LuxR family maltose regulon positive regulatory protein